MGLGNKLLELRKMKGLSQEEVADKLNVTRQTISKWETDQSTPDFDKIAPLCSLYGITSDELLTGKKDMEKTNMNGVDETAIQRKKAMGIGLAVLVYFIATAWIVVAIPALRIDPIIATGGFLLLCGITTFIIIYTSMVYKTKKDKEEEKKEKEDNSILKQIIVIIETLTLIIYLLVSFLTMAWYITWILWIVSSLVVTIVKLLFSLRGDKNEK